MVKYILYFLTFCGAVYHLNAQKNIKTDSIQLFYKINEIQSEQNFKKVDSLFSALGEGPFKLKINGYADFLNNTNYNLALSQKRADAVKEYLQTKHATIKMEIVECKGVGEKYSKEINSKEGESFQRRVVVKVEREVKVESKKTETTTSKEKIKPEQEPKNDIGSLSKGQSLALQGLTFIPGRHVMVKGSMPILEKLLKTLQENKNLKIEIQGHVCCTNGQDDGLDYDTRERKLSENRARAIYDYLVSKGISAKRLSYKGFGHSKPLYPNESTPEEEQANRRVEILIVEK